VQRANKSGGGMGPPKTSAGRRSIPIPDELVRILREWKLASGDRGGLVFGTGDGKPESLANIYNRCWKPLQLAAGITVDTGTKDAKGKPILAPRFNFHALRHARASVLIAAGASLPEIAAELGHADPAITLRIYSHLFSADETRRRERTEQLARDLL
jgi:integrase